MRNRSWNEKRISSDVRAERVHLAAAVRYYREPRATTDANNNGRIREIYYLRTAFGTAIENIRSEAETFGEKSRDMVEKPFIIQLLD
jgi:hypothetical protein